MKQVYDKSVEKFDKLWGLYDPKKSAEGLDSEIKHFIKHHTLALIDAEIERVEGMKTDEISELQCPVCGYYCLGNGGNGCIDKRSQHIGELRYNEAVDDHLTHLKEQREIISNS